MADTVNVKYFTTYPPTLTPGKVVKVTGPQSYPIELLLGQVICRHVDAIYSRKTLVSRPKSPSTADGSTADDFLLSNLPVSSPTVVSKHPSHSQPLRQLDNVQNQQTGMVAMTLLWSARGECCS